LTLLLAPAGATDTSAPSSFRLIDCCSVDVFAQALVLAKLFLRFPPMSWLVYLANFLVEGVWRAYAGVSEERACTSELALKRRREFHLDPPEGYSQAAWLQGLDRASLQMRTVQTGLTLKEALLQEAILAAQYIAADSETARGGPWCRRKLSAADRKEVKAVFEAKSNREVLDIAKKYPEGSLAYHLAQKPWPAKKLPTEGITPPLFASPPNFFAVKRRSGRHKPGVKRASGRHRPGVKKSGRRKPVMKKPAGVFGGGAARLSGRSGSQSSGAERRFLKLPLPRSARAP